MNKIIDKIENDTKENIDHMKFISTHEDYMLQELDMIERNVDKYLNSISKQTELTKDSNSLLFERTLAIDQETKKVQNEITNIQRQISDEEDKCMENFNLLNKGEKLFNYDNPIANEHMQIDVNFILFF